MLFGSIHISAKGTNTHKEVYSRLTQLCKDKEFLSLLESYSLIGPEVDNMIMDEEDSHNYEQF